ncbi:uncharacterized protein LOC117325398 [Pecten maximus]|uniref:uncharacterized protein LOC117325398 n=1 Tax=Pecten maximus TaxID=6579 RepID=UPI0014588A23|nr:uncharacterized protein LOC117325398 [Pecten maximus]
MKGHYSRQDDYKSWTPVRKLLKPGAITSVFNWNDKPKTRRILKRKGPSPLSQPMQSDVTMCIETQVEEECSKDNTESDENRTKRRKIETELETAKNNIKKS